MSAGDGAPGDAPGDEAPAETYRIVSWNVNGLRAVLRRRYGPTAGAAALLADHAVGGAADAFCLQETKLRPGELRAARELALAAGWEAFFSCDAAGRAYSGTATFVRAARLQPCAAELGFSGLSAGAAGAGARPHADVAPLFPDEAELRALDGEGRVVITDHGAFVLYNVYAPAITSDDPAAAAARVAYKARFFAALEARWRGARADGRAVVVVGDLNVAPAAADTAEPGPPGAFYAGGGARGGARAWLRALLAPERAPAAGSAAAVGFVDCFRAFHPGARRAFTCWNTATGARENNHGARIDLILAAGVPVGPPPPLPGDGDGAPAPALWLAAAGIQPEVEGSDHCPVWAELGAAAPLPSAAAPPPEAARFLFAGRQATLGQWLAAPAAGGGSSAGAAEAAPAAAPIEAAAAVAVPAAAPSSQGAQKRAQASLRSFLQPAAAPPPAASALAPAAATPPPPPPPPSAWVADELAAAEAARRAGAAAARDAWAGLRRRMAAPPACRHGDPCALKRVAKSGPTRGRFFYACARAAGSGPAAQCGFFQWVEERGGGAPGAAAAAADGGGKRPRAA
jgi:AP endonuclease-2